MSKFSDKELEKLTPYTAGEQPREFNYIKLNTNESPYFPSRYAQDATNKDLINNLRLYSDPECSELCSVIAAYYGVNKENILPTNGSDEALAFAFASYGRRGVAFPDVTYGFYKVFANFFGCKYTEISLKSDYSVDIAGYFNLNKTIFIANPNAQTGIYLPLCDVEEILKNNADSVVVIDEAYVDFGGQSCVELINTYDNLIVVQTFSKSRSLAGARVGFAIANSALISDLKRVKFSFNPYNVNSLSARLAARAMADREYFKECTEKIVSTRKYLVENLKAIGFNVLPSLANFVMAESDKISGENLYLKLKERKILVRHFADKLIENFVRISVGSDEQIKILLAEIKNILEEECANG